VLKRKMNASNIEAKYHEAEFTSLTDVKTTLLHPKKELDAPKMIKKGKKEVPESADDYINRVYEKYPIPKGLSYFAKEYTEKSLEFINESPRHRSKNLMLLGEPGRGKTHLACAIGKEYLKQGKTVHFTTMLKLVSDVMNPDIDIRKIVREKDLLIVDEVGYEYHTDTQWALKQIKELFRTRYNSHLPIICTTNFYPNELAELYDPSLMSMFNGSYFFILMQTETDYRLEEASEALKDFTFIEEIE
jgi:DNA replication protein DnaC